MATILGSDKTWLLLSCLSCSTLRRRGQGRLLCNSCWPIVLCLFRGHRRNLLFLRAGFGLALGRVGLYGFNGNRFTVYWLRRL
ncbi:hypothetical protein F5Y13DRAFT_149298 [Hypoxylon sp. FL1857]|nr:hypothetical protein F5Y13DRAFT_149298 [Hypoxylon sp. FL1857]